MNTGRDSRIGAVVSAAVLCAALAIGAIGCEFKGGGTDGTGETMDDHWQPRPASLRVYPSSRFTQSSEGALLEARIELRDEMGDAVKAAGTVGVELLATNNVGDTFDRRLYRWDVRMQTLEDQRTYFDPVTRTYLYRLELDEATTRRPTLLRVTFTAASDGRRLQAEAPIQPQ